MAAAGFTALAANFPEIAPSASASADAPPPFDAVHDLILGAVSSGRTTGLAVAATQDGKILWEEGFGWADISRRAPVTAHTPFSLASLSKPFTTTAALALVAAGKLDLNASAATYLGRRIFPDGDHESDEVTAHRLGAHAAGLPSLFEMRPVGTGKRPLSTPALLHEYGALVYPPGKVYEYSNLGYAALGEIIACCSGESFGDFLTRRVLRPLGLTDSLFDDDASRLRRAALRYDERGRAIPFYQTATPASGELYGSVHDLARFAMSEMGESGAASLLPDAVLAESRVPVLTGPTGGAVTFGWFRGRTPSGIDVLFKDGGQPGVATGLYIIPAARASCVVLANRTDNGDLVQTLCDQMAAVLSPGWSTPDVFSAPRRTPFSSADGWAGSWTGKLLGGGTDVEAVLTIMGDDNATLTIGAESAQPCSALKFEGGAFTAKSHGLIPAPTVRRNRADVLAIKLFKTEGHLLGRILATAKAPGHLAIIPFQADLRRKDA